jgi:hypothetical protein
MLPEVADKGVSGPMAGVSGRGTWLGESEAMDEVGETEGLPMAILRLRAKVLGWEGGWWLA